MPGVFTGELGHNLMLYSHIRNQKRRTFNLQYKPLSPSTIKRYQKYFDSNGQITYQRLKDTNPGVFRKLKGIPSDLNLVWLDVEKGQPLSDWWSDISAIRVGFNESTGYPTQKPIALLERIIKASSNDSDLVLDPFCGCGTTIIAASKLNRRFIGIDIDLSERKRGELPTAFQVIKNRGHELFSEAKYVSRDLQEVLEMKPKQFEDWVNEFYGATKPYPDKGIDGITVNNTPIQVKSFRISYKVLSQFVTDAKYHPNVKQPICKVIVVSQVGFDDGARQRKFEIETVEGIEVLLTAPEDMLKLESA